MIKNNSIKLDELKKKYNISDTLSTHQVSQLLGVSPTTVIAWIKQNKIKCIKTIGGHRRIPIGNITKVMQAMGIEIDTQAQNINQTDKPKESKDKSKEQPKIKSKSKNSNSKSSSKPKAKSQKPTENKTTNIQSPNTQSPPKETSKETPKEPI